jgi:hypothetical protein
MTNNLIKEIERISSTVKRGNSGQSSNKNMVLEACGKAADMVRELHKTHEAEGETLAQHLEHIGNTFHDMCKEAARQVRELRIMPKEMAEQTATDLMKLGQDEAKRHETISSALITARNALLSVTTPQLAIEQQKPDQEEKWPE